MAHDHAHEHAALRTEQATIPPGHSWNRLPMIGVVVAVIGIILCAILGMGNPRQFFFSWLVAFVYFQSLVLGALFYVLIQYASPLAAATLPRQVNSASALQAASPAYESARLFRMIGVGTQVLRAFGLVLVLVAGLSVFIALLNALEERRYDLAVMRMLGASRARLMGLLLLEGAFLSALGGIAGIALGHLLAEALGAALAASGRTEEAIPELEEALRLKPDLVSARRNLEIARNAVKKK